MKGKQIDRISYRNSKKESDFEIVDLQLFFSTRPHTHLSRDFRLNFWTMLYIAEGEGAHYIDFNRYEYKSNSVVFVQKNQVHHYEVNKNAKGYVIHVNEPFFFKLNGICSEMLLGLIDKALGSPVLSLDMSDDGSNKILIDLIYREYNKRDDTMSIDLIAALFQSFVIALNNQLPENTEISLSKEYYYYKEFRQLVETNFMKTRTVDEYAHMMAVSKKTINQATRKVAGLSAKEFIINRIVLEIKRYLSQGDLLNYEIAELLGFDEAANMSKFFKHYEGLSPKQFKEALKQENTIIKE